MLMNSLTMSIESIKSALLPIALLGSFLAGGAALAARAAWAAPGKTAKSADSSAAAESSASARSASSLPAVRSASSKESASAAPIAPVESGASTPVAAAAKPESASPAAMGSCTASAALSSRPVTAITLELVRNAKKFARDEGCPSILFVIDTPGGSLPATRLIVQEILNSPIPFLCLVSPHGGQAASAGAIILQACHVNGALRGTNIGAATPVALGRGMDKESDLRKKALNDTMAFVDSLTALRKRNQEFGRAIVKEAKSVPASEAFRLKAIDFLGESQESFLSFAQGRSVKMAGGESTKVLTGPVKPFPLSFRYSLLHFFADPQLLYLLFLGGVMLIYFELTHPGMILPGVTGGIALVLSLIGMNLMSVTWGALALIFFGLCLWVAEAFVPSFGVLGIGGAVAFVLGSLYLFDPLETGSMALSLSFVLPLAVFFGLIFFGATALALKTLKIKRHKTGFDELVGQEGEVEKTLKNRPQEGYLFLNGESWRFSSADPIAIGDKVKVVAARGMALRVKKI